MSSYHASFTYLNINSYKDKNLRIVSFSPDNGEQDTFLSMTAVTEESYDGTHRFDYGARYDSVANFTITLIKQNGEDFTVAENRDLLRWITGAKINSWLDLFEHEGEKDPKYSFFGRFINVQQYKLDSRVVGLILTFESMHPWAYSGPFTVNCTIGSDMLGYDGSYIYKDENATIYLGIDDEGVVYNSPDDEDATFYLTEDGILCNSAEIAELTVDNGTDDLYTYIDIDVTYENITGNEIKIKNKTIGEESHVKGISPGEIVTLNAGQFIVSYFKDELSGKNISSGKIFGNNFNFVFPRLAPGENEIIVDSSTGKGHFVFTYRYPIKIGNCAIDI